MEKLLELKNISVHYGGVRALDGVDVSVDEGEIIALVGPNGAGKSTVLRVIFGLAPTHGGRIFWHNGEIKPVSHEVAAMGISFVPQGRRVFNSLSVKENLEIGGFQIKGKLQIANHIREVMDIFPALRKKMKAKAGNLSGGEQQMVALGRGLMTDPKILLLDEPSLGLAPKIVKEVFERIKELNERRKIALLIVEHNIKSLLEIATRAYIMDKGKVVRRGKPREIIKDGTLEKIFTGRI